MENLHFCLGILAAILLAKLDPSIGNTGGILKPEITVKYIAVSIIFFNSGITLPTEELTGAILQWDLHVFVQGFTFVAFPIIVYVLVSVLKHSFLHPALLEGMTVLSTMPPPVSSAIILTKAVGGNEAAAVFNSAFGSMLGIFVTPFLILLLLGSSEGEMPYKKIFQQLFVTVVLPLIIGQIIRNTWYKFYRRQQIPFKTIGQWLILFIIYTTFCATFSRTDFQLDALSLVFTILLMALLLVTIMLLILHTAVTLIRFTEEDAIALMYVGAHKNLTIVFLLQLSIMRFLSRISSSSVFSFTSTDSVAITYCGTHKSLTLGIPMIDIIFADSPNISLLSIPLLMYNPIQILLGGMSIEPFRQWLLLQKRRRRFKDLYHTRKPAFTWSHV